MSIADRLKQLFFATAREEARTKRQAEAAAHRKRQRLIVLSPVGINIFAEGVDPKRDAAVLDLAWQINAQLDDVMYQYPDVPPAPTFWSRNVEGWIVGGKREFGIGYALLSTDEIMCFNFEIVLRHYRETQAAIGLSRLSTSALVF